MQKLVFNHVSILTAMIPDPAITGHARPLIARLELPMCFQPDGGISDSSSESDEGDEDIHRDSLYRWFEMRATWDLLTRPDGLSMRALRNLFVQAHGEPSPMWFSVIVDSGWFELFIPTRLPLAPLVLEEEGVIFTCLESVAHVRLVDCTRPGPLGNRLSRRRRPGCSYCLRCLRRAHALWWRRSSRATSHRRILSISVSGCEARNRAARPRIVRRPWGRYSPSMLSLVCRPTKTSSGRSLPYLWHRGGHSCSSAARSYTPCGVLSSLARRV